LLHLYFSKRICSALDRYPTSFVNSNTFFGKSVVLFSLVFSYLKKPTTMAANATNEVDNAMKKLLTNPGVTQYLICNADGIAIKYHNMDWKTAVQYCALVNDLVQKSKAAVEALLDPSENTVEYIRLHTAKNKEIIIAPAREYTLIAVQEPIQAADGAVTKKED
jgi:hypothetical protein